MKEKIRIGCGAGFSGDRLEPAIVLADKGNLDYLVLECLAERTISLAQKRKQTNPNSGYDPLLERRLRSLLPLVVSNKFVLITNMGAANPQAAGMKTIEIAKELGIPLKVAVVSGDDVFSAIDPQTLTMETGQPLSHDGDLISANAYLGIEALLPALESGAQVIITGRVADPSLFLAPMVHAFQWDSNDFERLGQGTVVGHLLECAGHLTGGYYMDPGIKDVPDPAHLGHPFADVFPDGKGIFSKVDGTGGLLNRDTAKEQLLYEVVNPTAYLTPDVSANFMGVIIDESGQNEVTVTGGTGHKAPETFKVSVGYRAFYLGEGEISYAGTNALRRAELAGQIVRERLANELGDVRIDLIGYNSVHRSDNSTKDPYEVRIRASAKCPTPEDARRVGEEVEALYTNGPAGGGGARKNVTEIIGIRSILIPRNQVKPSLTILET